MTNCQKCVGDERPEGHKGFHTKVRKTPEQREAERKLVQERAVRAKLLTCRHTADNFIGSPGKFGKCVACGNGKVVTVKVPGVRRRGTDTERMEAMRIDVHDSSTWPPKEPTYLTCGHGVGRFVGPPGKWGRCSLCGQVARTAIPGVKPLSEVERAEAMKIVLAPLPEPGSGAKPDKPLGFPRAPAPEQPPAPVVNDGVVTIPLEKDGFILHAYNVSYRRKENPR